MSMWISITLKVFTRISNSLSSKPNSSKLVIRPAMYWLTPPPLLRYPLQQILKILWIPYPSKWDLFSNYLQMHVSSNSWSTAHYQIRYNYISIWFQNGKILISFVKCKIPEFLSQHHSQARRMILKINLQPIK